MCDFFPCRLVKWHVGGSCHDAVAVIKQVLGGKQDKQTNVADWNVDVVFKRRKHANSTGSSIGQGEIRSIKRLKGNDGGANESKDGHYFCRFSDISLIGVVPKDCQTEGGVVVGSPDLEEILCQVGELVPRTALRMMGQRYSVGDMIIGVGIVEDRGSFYPILEVAYDPICGSDGLPKNKLRVDLWDFLLEKALELIPASDHSTVVSGHSAVGEGQETKIDYSVAVRAMQWAYVLGGRR